MISLPLNPENPGEVLACLGLFEIAHLYEACYGGFKEEGGRVVFELQSSLSLRDLLQCIKDAEIKDVPREEFSGGARLEFGEKEWSRWSPIRIRMEFPPPRNKIVKIVLKWWLNPLFQKEEKSFLKGWSGNQKPLDVLGKLQEKIQEKIKEIGVDRLLQDFWYRIPFPSRGFDARGAWDPAMTGYSFEAIKKKSEKDEEKNPYISPLCEFLAFVALRSFHPREVQRGNEKWIEYYLWKTALPHNMARLALIGVLNREYLLSGWRAKIVKRGSLERGGSYGSLGQAEPIFL